MSFIEISESEFKVSSGPYNYQSTIPKSCVHRAVLGEVFLTDTKRINDNKYVTAGYLPKSHIYFNDLPCKESNKRFYDAIILLEICRQTSIYVTHNFFDVPYSAKFVFDDADFTLLKSEIPYKSECSNVIVEVDIIERKYRRTELTGLIFQMYIYVDGSCCARKIMNISWMDAKKWHRLRSKRPLECYDTSNSLSAATHEVGRQLPLNVVIGDVEFNEDSCTTSLIVDQNHPSIFDHPLDHVPGMLLIEAYRQTALVSMCKYYDAKSVDLVINRYEISFKNFCEFNLPAHCNADIKNIKKDSNAIAMQMTITQGEKIISNATLTISIK